MDITVFRNPPLSRETRDLPAALYNLARTLQARSPRGVVFVPIRGMQFLAILDAEEFVFVDSQHQQWAVLAWQGFRPQERESLDAPVPFEAAFYRTDAAEIQRQLQPEFFKAMQALAGRERVEGPARVLNFERPSAGQDSGEG
ncbi:MAG: hypothetical protein Q8N51_14130 [Gammaproteobacteria bacterium]|nr:hypothetical protein [Gammaproteobacteria bacterium]